MPQYASLLSPEASGQMVVGIAIRGIGTLNPAHSHSSTESATEEMEGQMAFLSGFLRIRPEATLELRYIRYPDIPARIFPCILARFSPERYDAQETGAFLFETLRTWCQGLYVEPITGIEELEAVLLPFEPKMVAEITRRDTIQRLDSPGTRSGTLRRSGTPINTRVEDIYPIPAEPKPQPDPEIGDATIYLALPFLLADDARDHLCTAILASSQGIVVSVAVRAHSLTDAEKSFLEDRITRCEKYLQTTSMQGVHAPVLRRQADALLDSCTRELKQFEDIALDLRIRVASSAGREEGVVSVLGSSLSQQSGYQDPKYARLENPLYSGGYRVRYPQDEREVAAMCSEYLSAALAPHAPSAAPKGMSSLLHLFDLTEASTVLRLPLRRTGPFPGIPLAFSSSRSLSSELPDAGIVTGHIRGTYPKQTFYLRDEDRMRHLYIVGQTGTGKSTLLSSLLLQDIHAGRGVALIDPHGELVEELLPCIPPERIDDVIYFNPLDTERPIAINLLRASDDLERDFVVNYFIELFYSLWDKSIIGGPMFEMYLRSTLMLLLCQPPDYTPSIMDVPTVLQSEKKRKKMLETCTNEFVIRFWREEASKAEGDLSIYNIVPYFTSKFSAFIYNSTLRSIMGKKETSIDFAQIMDTGKILILDLRKGRLGATNAYFVGLLVVGELLRAALARTGQRSLGQKPRPFYLYVDEFQNVATPSFMSILSEARKYGLAATLANQYIEQLDESIIKALIGNVGTIAAFRIGRKDAELLSETFGETFSVSDLISVPNYIAVIKSLSSRHILPALAIDTIKPEVVPDSVVSKSIIERSREKYGISGAEPEVEKAHAKDGDDHTEISAEEALRRLFDDDDDDDE